MTRLALVASVGVVCAGCQGGATGPSDRPPSTGAAAAAGPVRSAVARDKGLEIYFELLPGVRTDGGPERTAVLHFRNASKDPIRIFFPESAPFRAGQSVIVFRAGDRIFTEPEPRPHGIVIGENDFPLLAPGEEKTFEQTFTLDPIPPGPGSQTARRPGFEDGETVQVRWRYHNETVRWAGGAQTLDGETKTLFGGQDIPFIWTGKLSVEASWLLR